MANSVSVSSHQSYGSRVGNSLRNILVWIVLVIGSIVLLARNENRYVKTKAGLEEWNKDVQETVSTQINPDLEGKEVHLYGETASDAETLKDDIFWIITDDLKLKRTVEMYQWFEESKEECHDNYWWSQDCNTTYTYDTEWSEDPIDSSNFHTQSWYSNPSTREYESKQRAKSPITLWVYTLADVFVNKLNNYVTINLSEQNVNIPEKYKSEQTTTTQTNNPTEETSETSVEDNNNSYLYGDTESTNEKSTETVITGTVTTGTVTNEKFHVNGDYIYIWKNPNEPEIGDLKITFSSVKRWSISVVWKQVGNELTTYTASNGTPIALLEQWNVTSDDMFLHAQEANKTLTWVLRLLWLILMYAWFSLMFQFIETIAKVLPFLADIIWVWTGIIALWLTLLIGFLTIGIAWLAVRPVIWICCLVVAAVGIFFLVKSKKSKKENSTEKHE